MKKTPWLTHFQTAGLILLAIVGAEVSAVGQSRAPAALTIADGVYPYIRFEQLLERMPRTPEYLAPLQEQVDLAVGALFGRNMERALRLLDQAVLFEMVKATPEIAHVAAASLSIEVTDTPPKELTLTSRYSLGHPTESSLSYMLRLRSPQGELRWQQPLELPPSSDGSWHVNMPVQLSNYDQAGSTGPIGISLLCQDGIEIPIGQIYLYSQPLSKQRQSQNAQLEKAAPLPPELTRPASRFADRNAQLRDFRHPSRLDDHLLDRSLLANQLDEELTALKSGIDPYENATGDRWFLIHCAQGKLPYRIYAPKTLINKSQDSPLPVIIALHGMGGNEHLFPDGYGGGSIKTLADEHGFLLVSPRTYELAQSADYLDALLEDVANMYSIDHDRVYLLGHSLGAMTTMTLAAQRPGDIAAICAIAGDGRIPENATIPPTLAYLAENDWMVPAKAAEERIEQAQRAGTDIRSHLVPTAGHVLIVHMVLPDAIAWLMSQGVIPK